MFLLILSSFPLFSLRGKFLTSMTVLLHHLSSMQIISLQTVKSLHLQTSGLPYLYYNYTSTISWRGYVFTVVCQCVLVCQCVCVCVSVCLSVCVSGNSLEQNSSRTDKPIWTRLSLNGCFLHWLRLYQIW